MALNEVNTGREVNFSIHEKAFYLAPYCYNALFQKLIEKSHGCN